MPLKEESVSYISWEKGIHHAMQGHMEVDHKNLPGFGQEAETEMRGEPKKELLLGFPWERQGWAE